jgi:hypothetical protein
MIGKTVVEGERRHIDITFDAAEAAVAEVVTAMLLGDQIAMAPKNVGLLFSEKGRGVMLRALHGHIERLMQEQGVKV